MGLFLHQNAADFENRLNRVKLVSIILKMSYGNLKSIN